MQKHNYSFLADKINEGRMDLDFILFYSQLRCEFHAVEQGWCHGD